MNSFSRALHRVAPIVVLPLLASAFPAAAAPVAAPRPAAADNSIIPLPLTPIVPAGQRQCTERTASGLGYTMLRPATGDHPAADATVLVNYIGYLTATGAVFDQGTQSVLAVAGVIPGFSEGMQLVARTGIVRLCIPAAMAYGAQESGPIPANSDLVFQIELIDFKTAAEIDEMRKAQGAAPQQP